MEHQMQSDEGLNTRTNLITRSLSAIRFRGKESDFNAELVLGHTEAELAVARQLVGPIHCLSDSRMVTILSSVLEHQDLKKDSILDPVNDEVTLLIKKARALLKSKVKDNGSLALF